MKTFMPHFMSNIEAYKQLYECESPETWEFPAEASMLDDFRKLLVIRIIRLEKLLPCIS